VLPPGEFNGIIPELWSSVEKVSWRQLLQPFSRNIYIFIHQNMIERTEQKVQQKSTHKKEKKQQ